MFIGRGDRGWTDPAVVPSLLDHSGQASHNGRVKTTEYYRVRRAAIPEAESDEYSIQDTPAGAPVPPPTESYENEEADQPAPRPGRPGRCRETEHLAAEERRFMGDLPGSHGRRNPHPHMATVNSKSSPANPEELTTARKAQSYAKEKGS